MKQRLLTALPLIFIVSLAFVLPGWYGSAFFLLMALGMVTCGCQEAFSLLGLPDRKSYFCLSLLFALLLIGSSVVFSGKPVHAVMSDSLVIGVFLIACMLNVLRFEPTREKAATYMASLGMFLYAGWSLSYFSKLYFAEYMKQDLPVSGRHLLLFIIAVTKMADVGAYFAGSLTAKRVGGNHKLAPVISPKKSYEGLAGGIVFAVATALGLAQIPNFVSLFNSIELVIIGILAAVIGLFGDLTESVLKRAAQQKDSGKLPGIGGILDVLDSLIPIAPVFYAYVLIKVIL